MKFQPTAGGNDRSAASWKGIDMPGFSATIRIDTLGDAVQHEARERADLMKLATDLRVSNNTVHLWLAEHFKRWAEIHQILHDGD